MKKYLTLLFAGLALCATAFGLAVKGQPFTKTEAATKELEFDDDGLIKLGTCFGDYNQKESEHFNDFTSEYNVDSLVPVVIRDNIPYGFAVVSVGNGAGNVTIKINDNETKTLNQLDNSLAVFSKQDLYWTKYDEGKGYVDLISYKVLFRLPFNETDDDGMKYVDSKLYERIAHLFNDYLFTDEDKAYLQEMEVEGEKIKYSIPALDKVNDENKEPKCGGATAYAWCNKLSATKGESSVPYWTLAGSGSRKTVRWYANTTTDCLLHDNQIGVRPVIRIKYSKSGGGSSKSSTPSNVDGALIAGIITGTLGAGALIAFLIMWSTKAKVPGFKAPGWYYAIIFVATACCCVSITTLSTSASGGGGSGGGASCFKIGYYVQTTQDSGNGVVQVGYTAWLFRSDGTVSYCSYLEDTASASDFRADNYMNGTYKVAGSKLTISIPETYINNFGTVGGTYVYTIQNCQRLYINGRDAYHWVRGE